ncbi:alpha/beta fold hydrolase [Nonomuraea longicatena]|uniref:AB hydrolase-1 domain-containing protein n=1 Tax=Nonomuraea longicatena TaxID=83682 RepID=A0ABN1P2B7_9ACTN
MPEACKQPGATLHDPRGKKQYTAQAAAMTKALTTCRQADGTGLFAHLDALSIARDVEAIRRALGEERLSFTAHSLGGVAAAAYARLFPQGIRAMYVDSVGNQPQGWPAHQLRLLPIRQRMLTRFAEWCANTPACALHGQDAEAVWHRLLRAADRDPIPVTSPRYGSGKLTGWLLGTLVPLRSRAAERRLAGFRDLRRQGPARRRVGVRRHGAVHRTVRGDPRRTGDELRRRARLHRLPPA